MPGNVGQCCGVAAPPPGAIDSSGWDNQKDWYVSNMSPATSTLARSLLVHLGLVAPAADGTASGLDVLETHCGDACAAATLLPAPGLVASYTACDFSEQMVEAAKARLGTQAHVQQADSTALPFPDAAFDRYMSNLGCCCVADIDAKLKEARRVLRPGGVCAMSIRVEEGPGDTSFGLISQTLLPFGFPLGPTREGAHIGKDLPKLRKKLLDAGFARVLAWNTHVTFPLHDVTSLMAFVRAQPPVAKFLNGLQPSQQEEAIKALEVAGSRALEHGAIQMAVAVVVAHVNA